MRTAAIIQARMTSTRLPGKVLMDINGKSCLQRVIDRLRASKRLDDVIVATTTNAADDAIVALCDKLNCHCYRGSEDDVLTRMLEAAKAFDVDVVVEVTSDCPLLYAGHVDALINVFLTGNYDFVSNVEERTYPRGFDIRVCSTKTLERVNVEVDNPVDRQHCLTWMYLNPKGKEGYSGFNQIAPRNEHRPDLEFTLDTAEDLELLRFIYSFESDGYNLELTPEQIIAIIDAYPMMYKKVAEIKRKDYFQELDDYYRFQDALEKRVLNGVPGPEPVGLLNSEKKKNEGAKNVQRADNRNGRAGKRGRPAGKRK
jgi:spore coat polysaccharide biosynthesis protein SpsF